MMLSVQNSRYKLGWLEPANDTGSHRSAGLKQTTGSLTILGGETHRYPTRNAIAATDEVFGVLNAR